MSNSWTEADDNLLKQLVSEYQKQWSVIAAHFPNKTPSQVASRWEKYLDPNLIKGAFTEEEDNLIRQFVAVHGPRCWQQVTEFVPMRSAKQCRERWFNHLDPTVVNKDWTPEEDQVIFERHQQIGPKWALISRQLPGRTDNAIKNRWNASISKRVKADENGVEYLAPDTSKRKRRVAKQLRSRPTPIRTVTPETMTAPKPLRSSTPPPPQIHDDEISQFIQPIDNSGFVDISPQGSFMLMSPAKISPFGFSPTAGISPNSPFRNFFKSPGADDFVYESFDSPMFQ